MALVAGDNRCAEGFCCDEGFLANEGWDPLTGAMHRLVLRCCCCWMMLVLMLMLLCPLFSGVGTPNVEALIRATCPGCTM